MTPPGAEPALSTHEAALDRDILCPLCQYNMRGLGEPRCPECGYRFTWDEILDPARGFHPFLFEHHPQRNLWSWCRTLFAGLLPSRFWRTMHPVQRIEARRLKRYWLITLIPLALLLAASAFHAFEQQPGAPIQLTGTTIDGDWVIRPRDSGALL